MIYFVREIQTSTHYFYIVISIPDQFLPLTSSGLLSNPDLGVSLVFFLSLELAAKARVVKSLKILIGQFQKYKNSSIKVR